MPKSRAQQRLAPAGFAALLFLMLNPMLTSRSGAVEVGAPQEPVRYVGKEKADNRYHDGRLRPVLGVHNIQVTRANRTFPEWGGGYGWTYNHAPMLCWWRGKYYLHYLSNPADEHVPPGQTFLATSPDGYHWSKPRVLFPVYKLADGSDGMMHQRMGFYVAPDGRLLALGFHGKWPDPVDGTGIGRVVREIYPDDTFGPIYFIRYNTHQGWNEKNTGYPFYTASPDAGFVKACEALLADRLMTAQWWDEDQRADGLYSVGGYEALSYFHRKDGKVVGLWKWSRAALSEDEGKTWSPVVKVPSFIMDGAKFWGQKTKDGRFALVYNPSPLGEHRWPLAIVTGEDGIRFDNMLIVHGEVPPRRFKGIWKDFGPQYIRGIEEGNGVPPGETMWVCYSVNKEDMWVSRIPLPVSGRVEKSVADRFETEPLDQPPAAWNIYSPLWARVSIVESAMTGKRCLQLSDSDPYDYAKAARVFQEAKQATVEFRLRPLQTTGRLEVELLDGQGKRPVRLAWTEKGQIEATSGRSRKTIQAYSSEEDQTVRIEVDCAERRYRLTINGQTVLERAEVAEKVKTVERLCFRTGEYRRLPLPTTPNEPGEDIANPDNPVPNVTFQLDYVMVDTK